MPTVKKSLMTRAVLDDDQINYFLTGIDHAFFWEPSERLRDWRSVRDDLLADFAAAHPGRRPFFWWVKDSPGPRLRVGGKGDVIPAYDVPTNLHFGVYRRSAFVCDRLLGAWEKIGCASREYQVYDEADPPRFESQASYLDRLGLLTAAERKALPPDAFEPEVIS